MNVSRETASKFEIYKNLLLKWQARINLIGAATLDDIETRHFDDSLQLLDYLDRDDRHVMDWGSGGGFPGLILAIADEHRQIYLVESDQRKCAFLKTVSRETKAPSIVVEHRIEVLHPIEWTVDVITARAFAPLQDIFALALPWFATHPELRLLLLKGREFRNEIANAEVSYRFDVILKPSRTDPEAAILDIRNLRRSPG